VGWITAIEDFLKGEREVPPPMDRHNCRFGMWLDVKGRGRYGAQPTFEVIESLHRQVHLLGAELLEFHAQGQNNLALARLDELHSLRDELLEQLNALAQKKRQLP
jgi:hypothetical protein